MSFCLYVTLFQGEMVVVIMDNASIQHYIVNLIPELLFQLIDRYTGVIRNLSPSGGAY